MLEYFWRGLHIKLGEPFVPRYMGIPKLHKPFVQLRFIATSSNSYQRPLALHITYLFRAVDPDLARIWNALQFPTALKFRPGHWILRNSAQLLPVIRRFNASHTLQQLDARPPYLLSYDFERLYTGLNQLDLKDKLCWLLERIWGLRPDQRLVKVGKGQPAKWVAGDMPGSRNGRDFQTGVKYYTWDLHSAQQAVRYLIDHAYIGVAERILRQVHGIPMGTNPAVYMANNYLFVYEFMFMRDTIQVFNSALTRQDKRCSCSGPWLGIIYVPTGSTVGFLS